MPLTHSEVNALPAKKNPYFQTDDNRTRGEGRLGVQVFPSGTKTLTFRYRREGKWAFIPLGSFPNLTLADALLRRILFLGGTPDMRPREFAFGSTVPEMLQKDLALEYEVRAALQKGMALCESVGDYVGRDLLLAQLRDTEEDHAYWLEKQLGLIERIGLENYLQSQTGTAP